MTTYRISKTPTNYYLVVHNMCTKSETCRLVSEKAAERIMRFCRFNGYTETSFTDSYFGKVTKFIVK